MKLPAIVSLERLAKFCALGFLVLSTPAVANPYDDCILQHMPTAQNDAAVRAIEMACINKTSVEIPWAQSEVSDTSAKIGMYNTGWGPVAPNVYGLVVTMKNTTTYYVTRVIMWVYSSDAHISRYDVDSFDEPLPPGVWNSGPGEPSFRQIIKPGETRRFVVPITERALKEYDLYLSRGIPGD
jgi:hypothetical protein